MLVSLGAALFVLVPQQAGLEVADMSRVIQGVIAGVGFLGAGAIVKYQREGDVRGLTTAAGVWLTAAIGIACGLGRESTALLSTLLALAILTLVPRLFDRAGGTRGQTPAPAAAPSDAATPEQPGADSRG
jgi:putative Mg2+ transporter-C (MgtC) family protein